MIISNFLVSSKQSTNDIFFDTSLTGDDNSSTTIEEMPMNSNSKKISKPGKSLNHLKEYHTFLKGVDSKYIPDELYNPNIDEKLKKKLIHMVRNRLAAKKSRDKKSSYINELELQREKLNSVIR